MCLLLSVFIRLDDYDDDGDEYEYDKLWGCFKMMFIFADVLAFLGKNNIFRLLF